MAAIKAADEGVSSTILESMPRPARKLGISGKGRGNLTNTASYEEFLQHFNNQGRFLKFSFKHFFNQDLIDFFQREGLNTNVERGGRVFTASGKATEIVNCLIAAAERRKVKILTQTPVNNIYFTDNHFHVICGNDQHLVAPAIILATGGRSYPLTGSTGDGYRFARAFGHTITPLYPSLVGLKPEKCYPTALERLSLKNVEATLFAGTKKVAAEFGELAFLDGCLAGPIIITLSRKAVPLLENGQKVQISIDLKPALSHEKLDQRLLRDLEQLRREPLQRLLGGLMPSVLADFCAEQLSINPKTPCASFSAESRRKLRNWLKKLEFNITEPGPWSQAIVTAGGIDTRQINTQTLESKIVANLFFAGEIMDIDADTGGYNLQAAFSTGYLAGLNAAIRIKSLLEKGAP